MIFQYPDVPNPFFAHLLTIDEVDDHITDTKEVLTSNLHNAVESAWYLGELLSMAKLNIEHGKWLPYLEQQEINERTAQRWIRLRREIPELTPEIAVQSISKLLSSFKEQEQPSTEIETTTVGPEKETPDVVVLTATERRALERQHMEEKLAEKDKLLSQQSDAISNLEQENRLKTDLIDRPDAAAQVQELRAAQEQTQSMKTMAETNAQLVTDLRTENSMLKLRIREHSASDAQVHVQHPKIKTALNALLDMTGIPEEERKIFLQKVDANSFRDGLWTDLLVKSVLVLREQHDQ